MNKVSSLIEGRKKKNNIVKDVPKDSPFDQY